MTQDMIKLGWEEWLCLPDLHLPAIKAKIDTGARTSAIHATDIAEQDGRLSFTLHPIPEAPEVAIQATAPLKDRREVTSSNGETELRYVIETTLQFGAQSWPIEVTLTDRAGMAYNMLLGRMALVDHCVVIPGERHQQPDLSYDVYARPSAAAPPQQQALRIGLLGQKPGGPTQKALAAEAAARGHSLVLLDPSHLSIRTGPTPQILRADQPLPDIDAVLTWAPVDPHHNALLRQFKQLGSYTPNSAQGIASALDPLHARQLLNKAHFATPDTIHAPSKPTPLPRDTDIRVLLIGTRMTVLTKAIKLTKEERKTLRRAARLFKLDMVQLTFRRADGPPQINWVEPRPTLHDHPKRVTALFNLIEKKARPKQTT